MRGLVACLLCFFFAPAFGTIQTWNVAVLQGGTGFSKPLPAHAPVLAADADWTLSAWIKPGRIPETRQLIAGFGDPEHAARYFMVDHGHLGFWFGKKASLQSKASLHAERWQFVSAVAHDGRLSLYLDGERVATGAERQAEVAPKLVIGPVAQPGAEAVHFGGKVADFRIQNKVLDQQQLAQLAGAPPDPGLTRYIPASPHWPAQTKQMGGQLVPQPPSTLPHSKAPFSDPVSTPAHRQAALEPDGEDRWILGRWSLASAPKLNKAAGAGISATTYHAGKAWMAATVPGTVLTTLVDRGVYPDPAYGLNNMAIPESLNKHDWWYRTTFTLPDALDGRHLQLTFNGINYAAAVWVNGKRVGDIKGAFVRGRFDVTDLLHPGQQNAIAVRISPPPHPGVPHEQSLSAGPGPNGGMQALDGPTFIASEGWDWIPAIRDRNTGLWQNVVLRATGAVRIGDTHVVTRLPDPKRHELANIDIDVPLRNNDAHAVTGRLRIGFGDVALQTSVVVPPGGTVVHLRPSQYPALTLHHPRLWWPNGYGKPNLYRMNVRFDVDGKLSDHKQFKFGVRQISYELSLFDAAGKLRRVLVTPDRSDNKIVEVTHREIRKTPHGWAYSLAPDALHSPAVKNLKDKQLTPYLAIRVNGVRIAVKGGSWGMDDFMKRVSRKHLEPYFKLQRQAHFNVVRNWVGQSTEPVFYELADKYGMLVFNDFWQSTQNYNMEPMDDALFLRNAAEVVRRYRNHPSIALWFGRNEGVPQPLLNKRLDDLLGKLDGTRLYMPSSNTINLWTSGPYNYRPPEAYFTTLAKGFAVEVGTPSFPTLEAFKAMMPKADRWPISDDWAYHDWHQSGNGDVHSFMDAMRTRFGKPTSLADFERKAQMMNYVSYRAIFEGLNAHLWTQNTGRLLWMSHPAWPSTTWQIYSHDYDTQASYYGVKKAAQPVHVQMNLPDHDLAVINNTADAVKDARVEVGVYGLDGGTLKQAECRVDAAPVAVTPVCGHVGLDHLLGAEGIMFVALTLHTADGDVLSRNFYWTAEQPGDLHQLDRMPAVQLQWTAQRDGAGHVRVHVANTSGHVALNTKLTLVDAKGHRILPAYYSDNYINLAPGASRDIDISVDAGTSLHGAKVKLRGWNEAAEQTKPVAGTEQ